MTIINEIIEHPIYSKASDLEEKINLILEDDEFITLLNEYGIQSLNRIDLFVKTLLHKLNSNDPLLFDKQTLDAIYNRLNQTYNILVNYNTKLIGSGQQNELNTLNNYTSDALRHVAFLPSIMNEESMEDIRLSATSFRRSISQQNTYLKKEQEKLKDEIENANLRIPLYEESLTAIKTQYEDEVEKIQNQYTKTEEKFIELREKYSADLLEEITKIQKVHQNKLSEHEALFENSMKNFSNQTNDIINDFGSIHQAFIDERNAKNKIYDEFLATHRNSVEEIVGTISTNTIAAHFKKVADGNNTAQIVWQSVTVSAFISTIIIGYLFFIGQSPELSWTGLISRFIVTSAVGSLTAYAAVQAKRNEDEKRNNRQMEVELKTLDPYIASFDSYEKKDLKKELFPRIFGQDRQSKNDNFSKSNNENKE